MIYCINCNQHVHPIVGERMATFTHKNDFITLKEYYITCPNCGEELYDGIVNDINCLNRTKEVEFAEQLSN